MTTVQTNGSFAVSKNNIPFSNFMGGYFRGRRLRRRLSLLVLDPKLDPGIPAE
jgi:hypothetical protein